MVVIDTSNEVAGEGAQAHACIGRARRMMVRDRSVQHTVMVEAVQNHTPQVLVIDEMGTAKEVAAAKSIAQRGIVLVSRGWAGGCAAAPRSGASAAFQQLEWSGRPTRSLA